MRGKRLAILLAALAVAALLVITFRMGDPPAPSVITTPTQPATASTAGPGSTEPATEATAPPDTTAPPEPTTAPASEPGTTAPEIEATTQAPTTVPDTTAPDNPPPVDEPTVTDRQMSCRLVVRCDTLLDKLDQLAEEKRELVPQDGVLLDVEASFYEGETAFNVLLREARRAGLHLEYSETPGYRSAYIEGIGNLYEGDCGDLSGWNYQVNGWFPGYGSSRYALQGGDTVTYAYTCDMGADIGGYVADAVAQ